MPSDKPTTITPARVLDQRTGVEVPGSNLVVKGNTDVTVKFHLPEKQVLQGWLTRISTVLLLIGSVSKSFGWELPTAEIDGIFTWLLANWDSIAQVVGLVGAAYGSIRRLWRKPVEIEVIKK